MEDNRIIELYWQRDEAAIAQTQAKYGGYCHSIAYHLLHNYEDAEECVNDTYVGAWNAIPPYRPRNLATFLGRITRNLSLKKWRAKTAKKRGSGDVPLVLDELEGCIPSGNSIDAYMDAEELAGILDDFLGGLPVTERRVFLCRYWYFDSVSEIAARFGFTHSKVKMMLKRTRDKLLKRLEKEDIWI